MRSLMILSMIAMLAGCRHREPESASAAEPGSTTPILSTVKAAPPETETRVLANKLESDLRGMGAKTNVFLIFDRPDAYLIRAKPQTNPPDLIREDLLRWQRDRVSAFNEALVTNCDACDAIVVEPASQVLPARVLSSLTDKATLRQEPTVRELQEVRRTAEGSRYLWVVFGALEGTEGLAQVRSFIFETQTLKLVHAVEVKAWDDSLAGEPEALDPLIRRAFLRLTETLTP